MLKRIVFIRSGETDWNFEGRFQGWVAAPLNEHGRLQVSRLANFVRHIGLKRLYTSDSRRARQTAEILSERLEFEPTFDERLREQNVGIWQGLTVPEMHGWYPEEYEKLQADPIGFQIPGGESRQQVEERVVDALREYIENANDESIDTVGIISHTTSIEAMLIDLVPDIDMTEGKFGNSSVSTLARQDGVWRVVAVNDVMHLEGLESRYMPRDMRGETTG
jgi:broad specificity phosphatase PhoE